MCVSYITRYLRCGHKEDQQDVPCARKKRRDGTCPAGVKIEFVDHNTFCPQCLHKLAQLYPFYAMTMAATAVQKTAFSSGVVMEDHNGLSSDSAS
ncbi:hypothetical protein NKR19_g6673 [Coniochaeta hoffmannii]|uniref:Uncharacterized protein n=1 Tax=Coniochaeta hoffmannii TaxID=91930 RepID=A0AA38RQ03_9PEZI|nr:hypothetical protein NKR19_g6673 [Coniochaeta hoffmannii]